MKAPDGEYFSLVLFNCGAFGGEIRGAVKNYGRLRLILAHLWVAVFGGLRF